MFSKNVRITISNVLVHDILELVPNDLEVFLHKSLPIVEGYDPFEGCRRFTEKGFKNITELSAHQLTLPCKVFQNIIA